MRKIILIYLVFSLLGISAQSTEPVCEIGCLPTNNIHIEDTENHLIIHNMPRCSYFREFVTDFFVQAGICNEIQDVVMISPDVCLVNKSPHFNDILNRLDHDPEIDPSKQFTRDIRLIIAGCKNWCNANAQGGITWCVNYPELCLVNACNSAVFEIQNNCHICCQNGFSEDLCAAPFRDILTVMQKYLKAPCGCN